MSASRSRSSISTLKNLATSSDPHANLEALTSLCEIYVSSPDTYTHIFDVVKFWLAQISSGSSMQANCIDALAMVIRRPSTSIPWVNKRFMATKELWPVVSEWIQSAFERLITIESRDAMTDISRQVERALQHISELLLVMTDPAAFDNPHLPDLRGYFRASISSPSFLKLILRVWVHTTTIPEYHDAFQIFSRLPLSLSDCYLLPQSQRHSLVMKFFDTLPLRVMESSAKSLVLSFADNPLRSSHRLAVTFSFLDCASNLSPTFRRTLLAGRSLYWTMDIIKTLLRRCASQISRNVGVEDNTLNLLCTCLAHIGTFLATEGRRWIADVLKMRIIDCLWKMDNLFHTFDMYIRRASCIADILKTISVYAVHATIFFRIQTSIERVIPEGWKSSVPCVAEAWDLLRTEMSKLSPFMNAIDKDVFRDCLLSTCENPGARRVCTGCRQALYCSRECQRIDWENHRTTCLAYAEKFSRAEPMLPENRVWELLIIEAMLLYEVKRSERTEWYARLQQDFVTRNSGYTLRDVGFMIDLSCVPWQVDVLPLNDEKYRRLSREGMVVIKWRVAWAGLQVENCIMWIASLDPSIYFGT